MATSIELQQLYLAYFGRPPEPGALISYANSTVAQVEAAFDVSPEAARVYASSAGKADQAMVATAYQNLFNRMPSQAEAQYWVDHGASLGLSPSALSIVIAAGAQNSDITAVTNRLTYVQQWVTAFNAKASVVNVDVTAAAALAMKQLANINADPTTLVAANNATDIALSPAPSSAPAPAPAPSPQSFTLTTNADTFAGAATDDTFTGTINYTGSTENPTSTYNAATDTLDGGAGTDTLTLTNTNGSTTATLSGTRITNIEKLVLNLGNGSNTVTLGAGSGFTDVSMVISNGATLNTLTGMGGSVTRFGLSGLTGSSAAATFNVDGTALTGTSDAATFTLTSNGTSTATPTVTFAPVSGTDFYETLNIVSAGTGNFVKLGTGTETSLATVNISGSAALTLSPASSGDKLRTATTFDASAATGNIVLGGNSASTSLGSASQTVKLGSGDDTVFFGANLDSSDIVDGGAGRDTVSISAALTSGTVSALNNVTNVEVLRFDISGNSFSQDVSVLTGHGLNTVALSGTGLTAAQFNNLPASGITTVDLLSTMSGATLTLALANGSGSSDALTLRFANAATSATTLSALSNITGLETLNIVSSGNSSTNTLSGDSVAAQQVLTGSVPFTVTVPSASGLGMKLDASAFTARLTITGASSGNDVVVLGSGNDVINLRTGTDTITTGAQGSNAAAGWDLIGVAAGSTDTLRLVSNTATGNGGATAYTNGAINAALVGSTTSVGTGNATGTVSNLTLAFSAHDNDFSLTNAAGTASTGLAKGSTAQGLTAGDTLVVQSVTQNDAATTGITNVTVIKLNTATAFSTDIKSTFAAAMGTASVTGLAADANYLVEMYDSTASKTIFAVVNTGASGAGDTTLSAADFTNTGMAVIVGVTSTSIGSGISAQSAF